MSFLSGSIDKDKFDKNNPYDIILCKNNRIILKNYDKYIVYNIITCEIILNFASSERYTILKNEDVVIIETTKMLILKSSDKYEHIFVASYELENHKNKLLSSVSVHEVVDNVLLAVSHDRNINKSALYSGIRKTVDASSLSVSEIRNGDVEGFSDFNDICYEPVVKCDDSSFYSSTEKSNENYINNIYTDLSIINTMYGCDTFNDSMYLIYYNKANTNNINLHSTIRSNTSIKNIVSVGIFNSQTHKEVKNINLFDPSGNYFGVDTEELRVANDKNKLILKSIIHNNNPCIIYNCNLGHRGWGRNDQYTYAGTVGLWDYSLGREIFADIKIAYPPDFTEEIHSVFGLRRVKYNHIVPVIVGSVFDGWVCVDLEIYYEQQGHNHWIPLNNLNSSEFRGTYIVHLFSQESYILQGKKTESLDLAVINRGTYQSIHSITVSTDTGGLIMKNINNVIRIYDGYWNSWIRRKHAIIAIGLEEWETEWKESFEEEKKEEEFYYF